MAMISRTSFFMLLLGGIQALFDETDEQAVSLLQMKASFGRRSLDDRAVEREVLDSQTNDHITIGVLVMSMARSAQFQNLSLSHALDIDKNSMYIPASYVSLYESAGARIVPIRFDLPEPALKELFQQVNGLVIPGGSVGLTEESEHPKFRAAADYLMKLAIEANDAGIHFPIHGTCAGFELMAVLTAQDETILCPDCFSAFGVSLPLIFTPAARSSVMFAGASQDLMTALEEKPIAFNSHHAGFSVANFSNDPKLTAFWDVLSTSRDTLGQEFISTIEAKQYPFFATQWHFEKPAYEHAGQEGFVIPHSQYAIDAGAFLARNFAAEARKNPHRFASFESEEEAVIDKSTIKTDPRRLFDLIYLAGVEGVLDTGLENQNKDAE